MSWDLAIPNSWHLPFLNVYHSLFLKKMMKHWNLDVNGYWVIGTGC